MNGSELTFFLMSFVKRKRHDVQYDVLFDAK